MEEPKPLFDADAPKEPKKPIGKKLKPSKKLVERISIMLSVIPVITGTFTVGLLVGQKRIRVGRDLDVQKTVNKELPDALDYTSVNQLYKTLKDDFDGELDEQKLLEGLKTGLVQASGDPYTAYLNAKAAKQLSEQLSGSFSGIGAELGKDEKNNLIVIAPISGSPAEKAGVKAKDIIAQVDGTSTADLSIDDAVGKIRGPKGTEVKLGIIRGQQQLELKIVRDTIQIASVKTEILEGNIGYLRITQFSEDTAKLAVAAAKDFKAKGVKGIVLDLRDDPGGLVDAAVSVSSMWLKQGDTVFLEKRGDTVIRTYRANGTNPLRDLPTVVLMNGGSASASEITAGALSDSKQAILMGEKSFGKGSVQAILDLGDGSQLKVTIAHWFTPNGTTINKTGIKPDTEVKFDEAAFKAGTDNQKQAALKFLQDKTK